MFGGVTPLAWHDGLTPKQALESAVLAFIFLGATPQKAGQGGLLIIHSFILKTGKGVSEID
jgi:hypothetical protein